MHFALPEDHTDFHSVVPEPLSVYSLIGLLQLATQVTSGDLAGSAPGIINIFLSLL